MSNLSARHRREKRFRFYGASLLSVAVSVIVLLLGIIIYEGSFALVKTNADLNVSVSLEKLGIESMQDLEHADFQGIISKSLYRLFPDVTSRQDKRLLRKMLSDDSSIHLKKHVLDHPEVIGTNISFTFTVADHIDLFRKGHVDASLPESHRMIKNKEIEWVNLLEDKNIISTGFNTTFFTASNSRNPENAGILGALIGSFWVMLVTFVLSFVIGVSTAIYLEEFGKKGWFYDFIEININNLAAVPSIIFGLLGLIIFIGFFGLPRSIALLGGLVLTLMTLPTIVISSRAALKAVPSSVRQAAMGLGASRIQVIFHHVVPAAMSGIFTGSIIGMAQALGESAPLLMIGMVAFVADVPWAVSDVATTLPVQVYLWADSAEGAFKEKTYGAILVLMFFLVAMNLLSVYLRNRLEKKW